MLKRRTGLADSACRRWWIVPVGTLFLGSGLFGCSPDPQAQGQAAPSTVAPAGFVPATTTDYASDIEDGYVDPSFAPKTPLPKGLSARVQIGKDVWGTSNRVAGGSSSFANLTEKDRQHLQATIEEMLLFAWQKVKALRLPPQSPPPLPPGQTAQSGYAMRISVQADLMFGETLRLPTDIDEAHARSEFKVASAGVLGQLFHHLDHATSRSKKKQ